MCSVVVREGGSKVSQLYSTFQFYFRHNPSCFDLVAYTTADKQKQSLVLQSHYGTDLQ